MTPESERRALDLYAESLDLPVEQREAFLRAKAESSEVLELLLKMLAVESPTATLERTTQSEPLLAALKLAGRKLDGYRLIREIGGGAVGTVFEAEQLDLRRRVAVKVLRPEHCQNPEMLARFRQEPEFQAKLDHPNIVRILSTGTCDGWSYFAMDYIHGHSLAHLLEPGIGAKFGTLELASPQVCAALVEQLARALHFAHEQGVVHRDIKPHNVLIDSKGRPFLSDFGLARKIDNGTLTGSLDKGLRGTLPYMSPEQVARFHAADRRSDVYSLGAVLYQLLTHRLPFEADDESALIAKITSRASHVRPPHHFIPGFDRRLSSLCTKALEKNPEERYSSALELADELRAYLDGRDVAARPVSRLRQKGEHRRDPVRLSTTAMIGVGLVALGAFSAREALAGSPAPVTVGLPAGKRATVLARPIQGPDGSFGPEVRFEARTGSALDLPDGVYRLAVVDASGAFAELHREVALGVPQLIEPRLARPEEVNEGMVLVPAGRTLVQDGNSTREAPYEAFWIDRALVTNAEFRAFLEATDQWPLAEWSSGWVDLWEGRGTIPRPDRWDEMPVVKVPWRLARDYAEWCGKRLPTVEEWSAALGLKGEVDEAFWSAARLKFDFDQEPYVLEDGRPSTLRTYLLYARPARGSDEEAFGPYRLWWPFGQVDQWLESIEFTQGEAGRWFAGNHYMAHGAWYFSPPSMPLFSVRPAGEATGDMGFRCAKSAAPK